jgi:hypothetical protein
MTNALIALLLALQVIKLPVTVTTYGIDDQYAGRRHAASWHGVTPPGAPEVVDDEYMGAASNDVTLGTVLHVTLLAECNGERLEGSDRSVTVTIIDRLADGITGYVDLWPAAARAVGLGVDGCALGEVR